MKRGNAGPDPRQDAWHARGRRMCCANWPSHPRPGSAHRRRRGTVARFGRGRGVVVATGAATEIGRIGTLVGTVQPPATRLARRLDRFARQATLLILCVGLVAAEAGEAPVFGDLVSGKGGRAHE